MTGIKCLIEDCILSLANYIADAKNKFTAIRSVIIDGSYIRGDFQDNNSDIDLTITVDHEEKHEKDAILEFLAGIEKNFPKRQWNQKPLRFDVQWQTYTEVLKLEQLKIEEWNDDIIPSGYPKLWLYAFDGIENHRVIFGTDITEHYNSIDPVLFIPMRMKRLKRACEKIKGEKGEYEKIHGGVSQIKNSFEILRAIYLLKGFNNIDKNNVCKYFFENTIHKDIDRTTKKLIKYITRQEIDDLDEFRNELYKYSMSLTELYESKV